MQVKSGVFKGIFTGSTCAVRVLTVKLYPYFLFIAPVV